MPIQDRGHYRRHRGACPYYRENWSAEPDPNAPGDQVLYQIICLWDTPPVTGEEQQRCLHAANRCWRQNHPANPRNGWDGRKEAGCSGSQNGDSGNVASEENRNGRNGRSKSPKKEELAKEA